MFINFVIVFLAPENLVSEGLFWGERASLKRYNEMLGVFEDGECELKGVLVKDIDVLWVFVEMWVELLYGLEVRF